METTGLDKQASPAELRKFAVTFSIGLGVLSLLLLWKRGPIAGVSFAFALTVFLLGLVRPHVLAGICKVWMGLANLMGAAGSYLVLTLTFFLVFTPMGLVMRLFGRDPLHRRIDPTKESYWIPRTHTDWDVKKYEKMF
jgi:hypothetical protein